MKDAILMELANRWYAEAREPDCEDGSADAVLHNAIARRCRETKRECANTLRRLVGPMGGNDARVPTQKRDCRISGLRRRSKVVEAEYKLPERPKMEELRSRPVTLEELQAAFVHLADLYNEQGRAMEAEINRKQDRKWRATM